MGDAVKAIAGLAILFYAPQLAGYLSGAGFVAVADAAALYLSIGIGLVGASLIGSALNLDAPDTGGADAYSGIKLQTQKSNTNPVPQVYGYHRLAGNIIWQTANEGFNTNSSAKGDNRDYWAIIVMAGHGINDVQKAFAGTKQLTAHSNNQFRNAYVQFKWYDAQTTPTNLRDITWSNQDADANSSVSGLSIGAPDIEIPANITFLAVHQIYDRENNAHAQLDNVTIELEGKKLRTIDSDTTIATSKSYSDNPAEIVLDLLLDGLNVNEADIDIDSFYLAKTICDNNNWTCNIVTVQQANIQSVVQDVLSTFRGSIVHSSNKWKLKVDSKETPVVAVLGNDDFLNNSIGISMKGNRDISNKIMLKYVNPHDSWLSARVDVEDVELQALDGQILDKTLDVKGVTTFEHAKVLAEISLNSIRYSEDEYGNRMKQTPLALSFGTTVKNAHLEVGDIIEINHDILNRTRRFMILSTETDQSGLIQIGCREYCETHYKDADGNYLI